MKLSIKDLKELKKILSNKKRRRRSAFGKGRGETRPQAELQNYGYIDDDKEQNEDDDDTELKYNCIIVDDMANSLKDTDIQKALNKMLIKSRHINTMFIFTLQSYLYYPKILRKQITNITMFKPKNYEEWSSLANELFNLKKEDALTLYDFIYDKPYTHLDYDTVTNTFYKNFNKLEITNK
jgi:hypothetical protein